MENFRSTSSRSSADCAVEVCGCREVCVIADVPSTSSRLVRLGVASSLVSFVGASKSDLWLSVRGVSAEEAPRQQASLEWLGHVRSVTHYGERDKLESMETLMGLWVPHCGLSNEKALCPRVPLF